MITLLSVMAPLFRCCVYNGDEEESIGCWLKRVFRTRIRRYTFAQRPDVVEHELWNQYEFDSRPVTPPSSENERSRDASIFLSPGRRRWTLLGSFIL